MPTGVRAVPLEVTCERCPAKILQTGNRRPRFCPVCREHTDVEQAAAWARDNPERRRAAQRAWYHANSDTLNEKSRQRRADSGAHRRYRIKAKYGMTWEQLVAMSETQGGNCAICGQEGGLALNIDHCHTTGVVRGLLCDRCNPGLGYFRDDPATLRAAAAYLDQHRAA